MLCDRINALNWQQMISELSENGFTTTGSIFDEKTCYELIDLYNKANHRSCINMARHNFGNGEY